MLPSAPAVLAEPTSPAAPFNFVKIRHAGHPRTAPSNNPRKTVAKNSGPLSSCLLTGCPSQPGSGMRTVIARAITPAGTAAAEQPRSSPPAPPPSPAAPTQATPAKLSCPVLNAPALSRVPCGTRTASTLDAGLCAGSAASRLSWCRASGFASREARLFLSSTGSPQALSGSSKARPVGPSIPPAAGQRCPRWCADLDDEPIPPTTHMSPRNTECAVLDTRKATPNSTPRGGQIQPRQRGCRDGMSPLETENPPATRIRTGWSEEVCADAHACLVARRTTVGIADHGCAGDSRQDDSSAGGLPA